MVLPKIKSADIKRKEKTMTMKRETTMTPYQQIKAGKMVVISRYATGTEKYAPALFFLAENGKIAVRNPEIGTTSGYISGTMFNAHCRAMMQLGLAVTICETEAEAVKKYNYERGVYYYNQN